MSRTYRKVKITLCARCNKPWHSGYGYTVKYGDKVCRCDIVRCECLSCAFCVCFDNMFWDGTSSRYLPSISKVWDNNFYYSTEGYQQEWNRKHRRIIKQKVHAYVKSFVNNNTTNFDDTDITFPISKNQAKWDCW